MLRSLDAGPRRGTVNAPVYRSALHALLLCAALGQSETLLFTGGAVPEDVSAMISCLRALGATIVQPERGLLRVAPVRSVRSNVCILPCGENVSVLRFLLPVVGALGAHAAFRLSGQLPQGALYGLTAALTLHGMRIAGNGTELRCERRLLSGDYVIDGEASSQYVTGLLTALPLLKEGSTLRVTGRLDSAPQVALTERILRSAGVRFEKYTSCYAIHGAQRFDLPSPQRPEGDWSAAAPFLCMGALSREGVAVRGLDIASAQAERALLPLLTRFGAVVETRGDTVTVRRGTLGGTELDAADCPELVPSLAVLAAAANGETQIVNAASSREQGSSLPERAAELVRAIGGDVRVTDGSLRIRGRSSLAGGTVDCGGDHRIAMAAAVAACACGASVTVRGAECVAKAYPGFWEELACLSM